jgi:hypothetical protein
MLCISFSLLFGYFSVIFSESKWVPNITPSVEFSNAFLFFFFSFLGLRQPVLRLHVCILFYKSTKKFTLIIAMGQIFRVLLIEVASKVKVNLGKKSWRGFLKRFFFFFFLKLDRFMKFLC